MTRYSHVSRVADQNGRARSLFYDGFGRLVREVDDLLRQGAGNERVFTRDAAGHVTRLVENVQKDLGGSYQVVSYRSDLTYNEWDQLLTVQRFGTNATVLATERRAYDSLGNLVRGEDGAGKVTDGSFDGLGRLLDSTRNPRPGSSEPPVITTISRDDAPGGGLALVVTRQDGLGNSSVYEYDLAGRLVTRKLPGWQAGGGVKTWSYTYDTEGRLLSRIDGNGAQVRIGYDANKRPEKRWLAMPGSQTLSLNCTNETFAYDVLSRLYRGTTWQGEFGDATGPSPNAQTFVRADRNRDVFGRITSEVFGWGDDGSHAPLPGAVKTIGSGWTDGSGSEDFGFRRSRTTPSGFTMTFTPDAAGKPTQVALSGPNGLNLPSFASYRYEGGRLLRRDVNSAGGNDRVWATYGYDALGYLTAIDVRYGPGQPTDPGRYSLSVTRDIIGNVLDERYTKVSGKLGDKFTLDGFDRLQTAELGVDAFTGSPNADTRIDYALDAAHNRTTVTTTPGGTDTYSRIPNTNEYQDVNGVPYVQDGNGNLVGDGFYVYVYDYLDRLSEVYLLTYPAGAMVGSGASAKLVYPTSAEQKARTGVSSRITAKKAAELIAGARKRVDAHYSKWQRGGLDPKVNEGLQAATGEPALEFVAYYGYDIANRRVWKLTLAENTNFAWDGWTVADEFDGAWQETKSRFTPAGIGSEVGYAVQSGGTWTRYTLTANHLGSIVQVTDANGQLVETYEYDAYGKRYVFDAAGNPLADTQVANDRGFALHVHDPETGLVYMRNRYYSPYLGRLLTTDRLGVWNDPFG